jgi:hypothetical protein
VEREKEYLSLTSFLGFTNWSFFRKKLIASEQIVYFHLIDTHHIENKEIRGGHKDTQNNNTENEMISQASFYFFIQQKQAKIALFYKILNFCNICL